MKPGHSESKSSFRGKVAGTGIFRKSRIKGHRSRIRASNENYAMKPSQGPKRDIGMHRGADMEYRGADIENRGADMEYRGADMEYRGANAFKMSNKLLERIKTKRIKRIKRIKI